MENEEINEINVPARTTNFKPFLSVFIVLIILMSAYYFVWRNIVNKTKNSIAASLENFKYDSITTAGFPFSKKVKINNITFQNKGYLASKNQVSIKEAIISSFIFSDALDIRLKDIQTLDINSGTSYSITFNEEPEINISFYSNGQLKSFLYEDLGYRFTDSNNQTLYTADATSIKVESTMDGDKIDYSAIGELKNMQNVSILNKKEQISENIVPLIYNMNFDLSSSITTKDGIFNGSILKINNISIISNNGNDISLDGTIFREMPDPYSFGNLKIKLANYKAIFDSYKKATQEAMNLELQSENATAKEKAEYTNMINQIFATLNRVAAKNPETKGTTAVIDITRAKGETTYMINGENMLNLLQEIMKD